MAEQKTLKQTFSQKKREKNGEENRGILLFERESWVRVGKRSLEARAKEQGAGKKEKKQEEIYIPGNGREKKVGTTKNNKKKGIPTGRLAARGPGGRASAGGPTDSNTFGTGRGRRKDRHDQNSRAGDGRAARENCEGKTEPFIRNTLGEDSGREGGERLEKVFSYRNEILPRRCTNKRTSARPPKELETGGGGMRVVGERSN